MTLLILGIIIWWAAHLTRRLAPGFRQSLTDRMGEGSKGLFAGVILLSVILMVIGYRSADVNTLYSLPAWAGYLNNVLMVVALFLFGAGSTGSWLASRMRHPMLISMKVWAAAHLLVNGDTISIVLFGSMLAWAVVTVILINKSESWAPDRSVSFGGRDIRLIAVWSVMFVIIVAVHIWLGHNPFLGEY